ncbi:MAG TPA: ABC transporter ATP-binding protein [Acidimicrobiales bacterium]|nr:ABC transporter ATP-binding protein [Acidimicrobiales bacterium]
MTHPHTPDPPGPAVRIRGLAKTWPGGVRAVRPLDLDVAAGEVFGLLGPNGAGKSTVVGMLTTTVAPSAGRAWLDGHDIAGEPLAARAASAVVFQDAVVDRALSGRRNLATHARLWGVPGAAAGRRIAAAVRDFGLDDVADRPVASYSGGQRRRLEIARALLSEPRVLFLDEPTVGLDPRIRYELIDIVAELRRRDGLTVLLTTHYLDEAERLCDRVAIMHAGEVVALDTPAGLLAGLGAEVLELRVDGDAGAALAALRAGGAAGPDAFAVGGTVTVPLAGRPAGAALAALADRGLRPHAVTTRRPTLDDVYLRLTGDRLAA